MSQAINKEDIISGSPFKDIADEMQVALGTLEKFDAKIINIATHLQKDLVASNQKTLQSIEAVNKAELEAEKLLLAKIKTQQAELKLQEQLIVAQNKAEKAHQQKEKAYNREIQQAEKANSVYSKVDKKLADMVKTYRDLAIRKELGAKLTDKEAKDMDFLAKKISYYDSALKSVDATSGKFGRNVGNYASGWNGLAMSINQITREAPAAAVSMNTFFLAISNNLPMFFDELKKLKDANIELAKSGQPTQSVFKQFLGSLFSMQTALSVGVTLLTLYGAKLVEWGASLFQNTKAIKEQEQALKSQSEAKKRYNEEIKKGREYIANESSEMVGNLLMLKRTNEGSKERSELIKSINEEYGTTLKNIQDETLFQEQLNDAIAQFIEYKRIQYQIQRNDEKIKLNLQYQEKEKDQLIKLGITRRDLMIMEDYGFDKMMQNRAKAYNDLVKLGASEKSLEIFRTSPLAEENIKNLVVYNKHLDDYGYWLSVLNGQTGTYGKTKGGATKAEKQFNTEIEYTNDYISQQIELLKELQDLENQRLADLQQQNIEDVYANMMKQVTETGKLEVDELERLINEKTAQDIKYLEAKTNAEIQQLEFVYDAEMKLRRASVDAKYKDLLAQKDLPQDKRLEIEANYQKALTDLDNEEQKRYEDVQAKKVILAKKSKKEVKEIEKKGNEEINQMNDALIDAQIEFYKTKNEKSAEQRKKEEEEAKKKKEKELEQLKVFQQIQEAITDFLKEQIDKRIALLQKESDFAKNQQDYLQNLAANGNIFAKESIAEQIKIQREAQQEQMRLEKQKQNIEMISTGLKTFEAEISKGKSPAEALATTLVSTKTLVQLLSNLNFFAKGTDNAPEGYAVTDEQGAELHLDKNGNIKDFGSTKGAQMKYLEKGDKIITASKTAQIFSEISNAKKIASVKDAAGNSYDLKPLLQEMQGMRNDIKNNATQIKVHWDTMGNIIEQVTKGNDRVTNRYRVKQ